MRYGRYRLVMADPLTTQPPLADPPNETRRQTTSRCSSTAGVPISDDSGSQSPDHPETDTHATTVCGSVRPSGGPGVISRPGDEYRRAVTRAMHDGVKFYRGSAAARRPYVEADHSRADDDYRAEGTGVAERYARLFRRWGTRCFCSSAHAGPASKASAGSTSPSPRPAASSPQPLPDRRNVPMTERRPLRVYLSLEEAAEARQARHPDQARGPGGRAPADPVSAW
jgi:hypothetical protein